MGIIKDTSGFQSKERQCFSCLNEKHQIARRHRNKYKLSTRKTDVISQSNNVIKNNITLTVTLT